MLNNEVADEDQASSSIASPRPGTIEIAEALPVRLQRLDLERHVAIAPDGKRYVVATFADMHVGGGYITAVYPQQNGYLTLIRLVVCEIRSEEVDQALQRHISLIHAIQQGRLSEYSKSLR